jgi:hypothetical protein
MLIFRSIPSTRSLLRQRIRTPGDTCLVLRSTRWTAKTLQSAWPRLPALAMPTVRLNAIPSWCLPGPLQDAWPHLILDGRPRGGARCGYGRVACLVRRGSCRPWRCRCRGCSGCEDGLVRRSSRRPNVRRAQLGPAGRRAARRRGRPRRGSQQASSPASARTRPVSARAASAAACARWRPAGPAGLPCSALSARSRAWVPVGLGGADRLVGLGPALGDSSVPLRFGGSVSASSLRRRRHATGRPQPRAARRRRPSFGGRADGFYLGFGGGRVGHRRDGSDLVSETQRWPLEVRGGRVPSGGFGAEPASIAREL